MFLMLLAGGAFSILLTDLTNSYVEVFNLDFTDYLNFENFSTVGAFKFSTLIFFAQIGRLIQRAWVADKVISPANFDISKQSDFLFLLLCILFSTYYCALNTKSFEKNRLFITFVVFYCIGYSFKILDSLDHSDEYFRTIKPYYNFIQRPYLNSPIVFFCGILAISTSALFYFYITTFKHLYTNYELNSSISFLIISYIFCILFTFFFFYVLKIRYYFKSKNRKNT